MPIFATSGGWTAPAGKHAEGPTGPVYASRRRERGAAGIAAPLPFTYLPPMLASDPPKIYTQGPPILYAMRGARSMACWGSVPRTCPKEISHGKTPNGAGGHWRTPYSLPANRPQEARSRTWIGATTPVR